MKIEGAKVSYEISDTTNDKNGITVKSNTHLVTLDNSLKGLRILLSSNSLYSFTDEMFARGASVYRLYGSSITKARLDTTDILILSSNYYPNNVEITMLNNWVITGGNIIYDDNYYTHTHTHPQRGPYGAWEVSFPSKKVPVEAFQAVSAPISAPAMPGANRGGTLLGA